MLVFPRGHQPVSALSGTNAGRNVPISIVAHDKTVLSRISGWGWQDGLRPGADAPEWKMDTFHDRFMTAYGPKPGSTASPDIPDDPDDPAALSSCRPWGREERGDR